MTEAQVQQVIGPPTRKSKNDSSWIWRFTNVGTADEEIYVVFFTNAIVAEMNNVKSYYTSSGKTNAGQSEAPLPPALRKGSAEGAR